MNKYKKLIVLLLIIVVGVILFIYPKSFKQTYKDVQVFENGKKVRTVDIKLDGKIHKAHWIWQRLKFSEELNGSITIDGEKYLLHPYDLYMFPDENGNFTDNGIYECTLNKDKNESLEDKNIYFFITHDKSTLYIIMENKEFIYPYNTDEDYQKVRERMDSWLQF